MTTPPSGQYPSQYPQQPGPQQYPPQQQYPYQGPPPGGGGRKALPWIVGGAVVVVAALVVTLVLVLGGDDEGGGDTAGGGNDGGGTSESGGYDLSTPEKAAESFAAAAATGDGQQLLDLTCLNHDGCLELLEEQPTEAELAEAKELISSHADELAQELEGAEFGEATEASIPNAMEVPYRTPDMPEDEYHAFMFIEFEGDWLYAGSAGGTSPDAPDAGPDADVPTT